MKNRIQNFIQQAIAIIFSILFAVALINAIFFNKTVGINYNIYVSRNNNYLYNNVCILLSI